MSAAVDYLGHESEAARAFNRFGSSVDDARRLSPLELGRRISRSVSDVVDRTSHMHDALCTIATILKGLEEADEGVLALVVMARDYALETANCVYELAGLAMNAAARGGLVTPAELPNRAGGVA